MTELMITYFIVHPMPKPYLVPDHFDVRNILRIQIVALRNIFINQYKIFLSDFITKQASCKTCVIDLYFIA